MTDISKEAVDRLIAREPMIFTLPPQETDVAKTLRAQAARIAELEAERDRQYDQNCEQIIYIAELEAALATARADALSEAADAGTEWAARQYSIEDVDADFFIRNPILALIDKEPTT